MLRAVLKKNMKLWEECLPHVDFAYNQVVHSTIKFCPFEVVYGFKPTASIDLLPLPPSERVNLDVKKRAELIHKLHETTKVNIEKMQGQYKKYVDKGRKEIIFKEGDLVWLHLCKDQFPEKHKSKLFP